MALTNRYRIRTDAYSGFEVQIKRWWFPIWIQISGKNYWFCNTSTTIEEARELIQKHKADIPTRKPKPKIEVIEYVE